MGKLGLAVGAVILAMIFLAVTAMIVVVAPYVAILVVLGIVWFLIPKSDATPE